MTPPPTEAEKRLARECVFESECIWRYPHTPLSEEAARFKEARRVRYMAGEIDGTDSYDAALLAIRKTSEVNDLWSMEAMQHLANVLFADPGPKEAAARQAAREWWHREDTALRSGEHLERKA